MDATPHRIVALKSVPDLLALHRCHPERYPFFLESAAIGGSAQRRLGRYDILFGLPGTALTLDAAELAAGGGADFLRRLDAQLPPGPERMADGAPAAERLPFRGGWFVFLSYELAAQVEPVLRLPLRHDFPVALAVRIPAAIVRCRDEGLAWVVGENGAEQQVLHDLSQVSDRDPAPAPLTAPMVRDLREDPEQRFLDAVATAKRHIADGDVFQANLSRCWRAQVRAGIDDAQIYANLRRSNPAPFAGLARWGDACVISSSPERLIRLRDGGIETRPIAGTRPRGAGQSEDRALTAELLGHPKERAEHVMLIDLERNDLGRVCLPGSIEVDELMAVESYAHVHHIVSNVRGRLRPGVTAGDALRAVFPGGTITGCPKVRCMQLIAELEREARGAYTGSMGYLNHDGSGDFNILIRTLFRHGDALELRAGAGIVSASQPRHELAETRAKARGLLMALNLDAGASHA